MHAFAPTDCGSECDAIREAVDLGGAELRGVPVALDSGEPAEPDAAASTAGSDGDYWMWVGAEEPHRKEVVAVEGRRLMRRRSFDS